MTTVNNVTYTVEKKFNPKTQRSTDIITAQMDNGKKLQIGLSFGADGIWGTADDTIKVIAKDGPFSVNKIAIHVVELCIPRCPCPLDFLNGDNSVFIIVHLFIIHVYCCSNSGIYLS